MDMNKLTEKSREALHDAENMAVGFGHQEVDVEHLFMALMQQGDGLIPRLMEKAKVNPGTVLKELQDNLGKRPRISGGATEAGKVYITQRLNQLLARAEQEANRLKDDYVSVEHLILAMFEEGTSGAAARIMKQAGLSRDAFLNALTSVRGNQRVTSPTPETTYEALERYGRDLVALVRSGKLDPVIGRDSEIRDVILVLSRKRKNNPVLIGEPGVGKTAIVEGLAH
ncbi:MAG: type VI secretion system ATPase TssH, partial [Syntrophomonadaceae bacterium]|nr:type VI secretion system ATPase TssH [Syntrophomonadaceae bacterium]